MLEVHKKAVVGGNEDDNKEIPLRLTDKEIPFCYVSYIATNCYLSIYSHNGGADRCY